MELTSAQVVGHPEHVFAVIIATSLCTYVDTALMCAASATSRGACVIVCEILDLRFISLRLETDLLPWSRTGKNVPGLLKSTGGRQPSRSFRILFIDCNQSLLEIPAH